MSDKTKRIEIPAPDRREMTVSIEGLTPLLCDNFSAARQENIADREAHPNRKLPKEPRDPMRDYQQSLYVIGPETYGFPSDGIKKSLVKAGQRFAGEYATVLNGIMRIGGELVESEGRVLVPIVAPDGPRMHGARRVLGGRTTSVVYRAAFFPWSMEVPVSFDADIMTDKQIVNMFARAGESVGIGGFRPEKSGSMGTWRIVGGKL